MSSLWIAALCLAAADAPVVEVTNVAEAAALKADTLRVRIVMKDHQTLATGFKQVPNLKYLNLDHPGHRMPLNHSNCWASSRNWKRFISRAIPF